MKAASPRRTVLTGLGVLSAFGSDLSSYWAALQAGKSGVRRIQNFDASGLPVQIAAEIPDFNAKKFVSREAGKSMKVMARTIQLAVVAAELALADSKIDKNQLDPTRLGIVFGSGLIASEIDELGEASLLSMSPQHAGQVDLKLWGELGIPAVQPLWMLRYLPNMLACHVSILHNAQGPNNTITENEVAPLLAVGEARSCLRRNLSDVMFVGGAESRVNPVSLTRQCLFEPLSHRNDAPERASRPFDMQRDGFVLGEGSGILLLEELEHAQKRQAKIYAEVVGFAAGFEPMDKQGIRTGTGLARTIHAALRDAGITPADVDHINAHGLGTIEADAWEARAYQQVFGALPVPVLAMKSAIGNLGAGGAGAELVASLLAFQHGTLPKAINYEQPDPACPVTLPTQPRSVRTPYALKVSFTSIGQCAALVVKKW